MEIVDLPMKMGYLSIAILVYQRVNLHFPMGFPMVLPQYLHGYDDGDDDDPRPKGAPKCPRLQWLRLRRWLRCNAKRRALPDSASNSAHEFYSLHIYIYILYTCIYIYVYVYIYIIMCMHM